LLSGQGTQAVAAPYTQNGVILSQPVPVERLPRFAEGWVSVQDAAAQLAAPLLAAQAGDRVLDVCAAPGGKTTHILESVDGLKELVALDVRAPRLERVEENLQRLGLQARLLRADATRVDQWWEGKPYQRILLDAPCSATGVIRRHPDIKVLRTPEEVKRVVELQEKILDAVWSVLAPNGRLLYATCSILPEENNGQIARFIERTADACYQEIDAPWGRKCEYGRQILPGDNDMDGFFYAILAKSVKSV
jgi:16S rRNA (cytosine967-C5)-methyltransferase